jgi:N-acetylmuramoyl-L-alanine amidase
MWSASFVTGSLSLPSHIYKESTPSTLFHNPHPPTNYNQPNPLTPPRKQLGAAILLLVSSFAALAQTSPPPQPQTPKAPLMVPFTPKPIRTLILLDPAHGGPDSGAHLPNNLLEKDLTLAFNNRLRALLSAANFAVISTRTSDPGAAFTTDQRAEIANHDHPAVCLILHATSSGSGIHLFTSSLTPPEHPSHILHWNTAQAAFVPASRSLANQIGLALLNARLPVILGQATVPPLDNLTCSAIAIELAPLTNTTATPTPVSDATYQQHAAEAIAAALTNWRAENTAAGAAQ